MLGVYRFENNGNCTLHNQTLNNIKYYNKELIFENINLELKEHQISNKTLELKQIQETEILINEIPLILNIKEQSSRQIVFNIIMIILLLMIMLCKRLLTALVRRVKFKQRMGELSNIQPATSAALNSSRHVQIEIPLKTLK